MKIKQLQQLLQIKYKLACKFSKSKYSKYFDLCSEQEIKQLFKEFIR